MPEPGWFDVAGGKLTTYRLIAEQAVDRLCRYLGRASAAVPHGRGAAVGRRRRTKLRPTARGSGILPPPVEAASVVEHYCTDEWAVHLDDVMLRRTGWHYYHTDAAAIAQRVAGWMAECLGWDAAEQAAELTRYHAVNH